jgi:hypothetical protein
VEVAEERLQENDVPRIFGDALREEFVGVVVVALFDATLGVLKRLRDAMTYARREGSRAARGGKRSSLRVHRHVGRAGSGRALRSETCLRPAK